MNVQDWPSNVPSCIEPLSPQGGLRDNRLSFETDDKLSPIERPVSSWAPEIYSVELVQLSIEQFETFQNWYTSALAFGTYPFWMRHPITRRIAAWKIMKADPPYQVSKKGLIPDGSGRRRIRVSFSVMSWPGGSDVEILGSLFYGEKPGYWANGYASRVFQDVAATTPAVVGQTVAFARRAAGSVNTTQATAGSRPTLRQTGGGVFYLENDGGDSLPMSLPAGTYGRARVSNLGVVTIDTVSNPNNALVLTNQADVILRQGAFTAAEIERINDYWSKYLP